MVSPVTVRERAKVRRGRVDAPWRGPWLAQMRSNQDVPAVGVCESINGCASHRQPGASLACASTVPAAERGSIVIRAGARLLVRSSVVRAR